MLVRCGLVVFHLLPEKDCRLFKTSLSDLFWAFQPVVILAMYREFSSSNMLPVEYRVIQLKLNHMFNIVHGSAPEYLKNNINITREPAHNTRSGSFACYIPNVKSFGIKSFFFTGSKLWNSLSHSIQCITDKFIFK